MLLSSAEPNTRSVKAQYSVRTYVKLLVIILGLEICYFLSGYIFWYKRNVLNFFWSTDYTYFPDFYSNGFWLIPLLIVISFMILEKFGTKIIPSNKVIICALFLGALVNAFSFWKIPEIAMTDAVLWNTQARYIVDHSIPTFLQGFSRYYVTMGVPLPSLIFSLAYSFFGVHRYAIQLVNSILFSLVVVLVFLIGKALFSKDVGIYSGIFLLSSPFMTSQVPLIMVDITTTFFITLSVYQAIRMMNNPGLSSIVLACACVLLACLSKVTALLFLLPCLLFLCIIMPLRSREKLRTIQVTLLFSITLALIVMTVTWLYYLPIAHYYEKNSTNPLFQILSHPVLLNGTYWIWGRITLSIMGVLKSLVLSITIPIFILAIIGVIFASLRKQKAHITSQLLLASWIIIPVLYTLDLGTLYGGARYLMPSYPAFALLAASSVLLIKDKRVRRTLCVSILVFSIVSSQLMYGYSWSESTSRNLMQAADFLHPFILQGMSVKVCDDNVAAWMSIYEPTLYNKDTVPRLGSQNLFSCINPGDALPQYLVFVRARAVIYGHEYEPYPIMAPEESQFLIAHYLRIITLGGGSLDGPWFDTTVEIFMLQSSTSP